MPETIKHTQTLVIFSEDPDREPFVVEAGQKFADYDIGSRQDDGSLLVHEDSFRRYFLALTGGSNPLRLEYPFFCGGRGHDWEDQNNGEWTVIQALTELIEYLEHDDWDVTAQKVREILDDVRSGKEFAPTEIVYKRYNEECYQRYMSWGFLASVCAWDELRGVRADSEIIVEGHDLSLESSKR